MMTLLRAEAEGFRERCVPIEFAGAFDCAAALVAVGVGSRRGESRGVEVRER